MLAQQHVVEPEPAPFRKNRTQQVLLVLYLAFRVAINSVLVIGRVLVESDSDLPTAYGLTKQIQLSPLPQP